MKEQQRFPTLSSPLKITLLITSSLLPTWTASNSQPSPQKYQVPAVSINITESHSASLEEKPDEMLPNWPIFRELEMAGHCSECIRRAWIIHSLVHSLNNSVKRESVSCRNNVLKTKRKHQEEVQGAVELLTNRSRGASISHKLLKFINKFCSLETKMSLDKKKKKNPSEQNRTHLRECPWLSPPLQECFAQLPPLSWQ